MTMTNVIMALLQKDVHCTVARKPESLSTKIVI